MRKSLLKILAVSLATLVPLAVTAENKAPRKLVSKSTATDTNSKGACGGRNILKALAATDPALLAEINQASAAVENSDAVLWKIEGGGTTLPSYLFGTLHLTDRRIADLSTPVEQAYKASTKLLLESADPSPDAIATALTEASSAAIYTEGGSLQKVLTPAEYLAARAALDAAGVPTSMAPLYRPWLTTLLVSTSDCERRALKQGQPTLVTHLARIAKSRSMEIVGLEAIGEHLRAQSSVPEEQQITVLRATLALVQHRPDFVETMVQLYRAKHLATGWTMQLAFAQKAGFDPAAFATYRQIILVERNKKMRDNALPHLEKGQAFIAVGAMHLVGKDGLVSLLREAGYTLTAVE